MSVVHDWFGNAMAVGWKNKAAGVGNIRWIVRKGNANGSNFSEVDNYQLGTNEVAKAFDIAIDGNGYFYVVGLANSGGVTHWIVRRSKDVGRTWQTIDNFQLASGANAEAFGITIDSVGSIYVVGDAEDAGSVKHWIVRKLGCD